TPAIANLIRENKTFRIDSNIQTGKRYGMQLLDDHLWQLYNEGVLSLEDVMDVARHAGSMQERLDRAQAGMPAEMLTAISDEEEPARPAQ
ncbi:MAG: type IV pili twitching motility protein PilT, partial [Phycisphaerae bacterium]|nr:type IV pili twitching motility protein PilT [Phycisphaerae bacterium]